MHENACSAAATVSSSQRIGVMTHLSKFMTRPEAPANRHRISLRQLRSSVVGTSSTTMSSAYSEARCSNTWPGNGVKMARLSAYLTREFKTSMTMMNSIGDMRSPWRRPRACTIRRPGLPLTRTFVLTVHSTIEIQFIHRLEKPTCCITSSKNGQATESKAFAMSTLINGAGHFRQWSQRHAAAPHENYHGSPDL